MEAMIGRFVSPDPVGAVDSNTARVSEKVIRNPQRINLYAYGLNNPYKYIDPDGNDDHNMTDSPYFSDFMEKIRKDPTTLLKDPLRFLPDLPSNIGKGISNEHTKRIEEAFKRAETIKQRSVSERIQDIKKNPDQWEKIGETPDPDQRRGKSERELWQKGQTGELLERHVLEKPDPRRPHPHSSEPKKERWGIK